MLTARLAFSHSGQVCIAAKRIFVHSKVFDEFVAKFTAACQAMTPGTGYLSPIQNKMQFDKVRSIYEDCQAHNYQFSLGGGQELARIKPGYQMAPVIVVQPPEDSRLVQEEPFGPIVPILSWDEEEDVINRANNTDQGLGATVWCRDPAMAERISMRLEAGSVWVNRGAYPMPTALFGGIKQSGIGGEWGPLGLINSYCSARTFHFAKQ
jgi:acyl-CoA reductase-like NAD-dependent aldehyde dehydrogenase